MPALSLPRLMQESEKCLEDAARSGDEQQQLVAGRILDNVQLWCQWELEHLALVRDVVRHGRADAQSIALRSGVLGLIHRKALFEYLRTTRLKGTARRRVVGYFRGSLQYTDAVVSEHGQYLRSAGSHLCAHHLGVAVLLDGVFQAPIARYEELYTEYFHAFCQSLISRVDGQPEDSAQRKILPLLKHQVTSLHASILALPRTELDLDYEALIRRPTGDTQKLKRLR
jgi:hypothetical protein